MRALPLRLIKIVQSRSEALGLLTSPGDAVLIERGTPRWLLISCPCGCGEEFPINLDPRSGKAWRFYNDKRTGYSLFPSVWRDTGCCIHYVIWRNKILMSDQSDEEFDKASEENGNHLIDGVLRHLPADDLIGFAEIADYMGEVPWDVLTACRILTRKGLAREGEYKQRGLFGQIKSNL